MDLCGPLCGPFLITVDVRGPFVVAWCFRCSSGVRVKSCRPSVAFLQCARACLLSLHTLVLMTDIMQTHRYRRRTSPAFSLAGSERVVLCNGRQDCNCDLHAASARYNCPSHDSFNEAFQTACVVRPRAHCPWTRICMCMYSPPTHLPAFAGLSHGGVPQRRGAAAAGLQGAVWGAAVGRRAAAHAGACVLATGVCLSHAQHVSALGKEEASGQSSCTRQSSPVCVLRTLPVAPCAAPAS